MKALDQLVEAVDAILATPSSEKTNHEITATLRVVASQISRLQAVVGDHTLAMERTGAHKSSGHQTPAEFLKRQCHYSGAQARSILRSGAVLAESLPRTAEALKAGIITWPHATTLVRGVSALGPEEVSAHEEAWVSKVAVHSGPERLQRVVRARVHELTPQPQYRDECEQDERTSVALRKILGRGYEISGHLTPTDGAVVEEAVATFSSLGKGLDGADPIATIANWWLKNQPASHGQQDAQEDAGTPADPFGATRVEPASSNEVPTIKRCCDIDPVPLANPSATPLSVARFHHELRQADPQAEDSCAQPGCSATPHWCDFHGAVDQLARGLLAAA